MRPPDSEAPDIPSAARMYDYFLGGAHNFAVDRQAAEKVVAVHPDFPLMMRANRAFLRRAVAYLASQGVTQFLDIGSGIPTVGNVHQIVQSVRPSARVVYVDIDPIAVAHSEAMLASNPNATIIQADARDMASLLLHPTIRQFLDWDKPLAILLVAVLHFITDDAEAARIVATARQALPPGGYLVISHGTSDTVAAETSEQLLDRYATTDNPTTTRPRQQVEALFAGLELVSPGIVLTPLWRPESPDDLLLDNPARSAIWAGVGRKG
jgi:SAM-dependent methyltransferase